MSTGKGLIRSTSRKGVRSGKIEDTKADGPGRVLLRGTYAVTHADAIRRRIHNVAEQAGATQPACRVVSIQRRGDDLEVLTTTQELAHRIVRELKKAFRGRASYNWADDDGSLFAVWQRDA